jgi:transcriptional repressor NrdR
MRENGRSYRRGCERPFYVTAHLSIRGGCSPCRCLGCARGFRPSSTVTIRGTKQDSDFFLAQLCAASQGGSDDEKRPAGTQISAMKCPFCGCANDKVVDSRESKEAESIRRRRECLKCGKRFTTYERIDEIPYMVVKKDGRREKFDRQKVLNGLLRACEKRPVPISKLEQIVNEAESFVIESAERERKTSELGELIMNRLRRYDKVAYVRFASVYLDFKDVKEFMNELKDLVKAKDVVEAGKKVAGKV